MSAEEAYQEAVRRIDEAARNQAEQLILADLDDLETLPPEIGSITGLLELDLDGTKISDLGFVHSLKSFSALLLSGTKIANLGPLKGLGSLQFLEIINTCVTDLRPLLSLKVLWENAGYPVGSTGFKGGLAFTNTPATQNDPNLAALAQTEDIKIRAQTTRAHLQSLPSWPEPLEEQATLPRLDIRVSGEVQIGRQTTALEARQTKLR